MSNNWNVSPGIWEKPPPLDPGSSSTYAQPSQQTMQYYSSPPPGQFYHTPPPHPPYYPPAPSVSGYSFNPSAVMQPPVPMAPESYQEDASVVLKAVNKLNQMGGLDLDPNLISELSKQLRKDSASDEPAKLEIYSPTMNSPTSSPNRSPSAAFEVDGKKLVSSRPFYEQFNHYEDDIPSVTQYADRNIPSFTKNTDRNMPNLNKNADWNRRGERTWADEGRGERTWADEDNIPHVTEYVGRNRRVERTWAGSISPPPRRVRSRSPLSRPIGSRSPVLGRVGSRSPQKYISSSSTRDRSRSPFRKFHRSRSRDKSRHNLFDPDFKEKLVNLLSMSKAENKKFVEAQQASSVLLVMNLDPWINDKVLWGAIHKYAREYGTKPPFYIEIAAFHFSKEIGDSILGLIAFHTKSAAEMCMMHTRCELEVSGRNKKSYKMMYYNENTIMFDALSHKFVSIWKAVLKKRIDLLRKDDENFGGRTEHEHRKKSRERAPRRDSRDRSGERSPKSQRRSSERSRSDRRSREKSAHKSGRSSPDRSNEKLPETYNPSNEKPEQITTKNMVENVEIDESIVTESHKQPPIQPEENVTEEKTQQPPKPQSNIIKTNVLIGKMKSYLIKQNKKSEKNEEESKSKVDSTNLDQIFGIELKKEAAAVKLSLLHQKEKDTKQNVNEQQKKKSLDERSSNRDKYGSSARRTIDYDRRSDKNMFGNQTRSPDRHFERGSGRDRFSLSTKNLSDNIHGNSYDRDRSNFHNRTRFAKRSAEDDQDLDKNAPPSNKPNDSSSSNRSRISPEKKTCSDISKSSKSEQASSSQSKVDASSRNKSSISSKNDGTKLSDYEQVKGVTSKINESTTGVTNNPNESSVKSTNEDFLNPNNKQSSVPANHPTAKGTSDSQSLGETTDNVQKKEDSVKAGKMPPMSTKTENKNDIKPDPSKTAFADNLRVADTKKGSMKKVQGNQIFTEKNTDLEESSAVEKKAGAPGKEEGIDSNKNKNTLKTEVLKANTVKTTDNAGVNETDVTKKVTISVQSKDKGTKDGSQQNTATENQKTSTKNEETMNTDSPKKMVAAGDKTKDMKQKNAGPANVKTEENKVEQGKTKKMPESNIIKTVEDNKVLAKPSNKVTEKNKVAATKSDGNDSKDIKGELKKMETVKQVGNKLKEKDLMKFKELKNVNDDNLSKKRKLDDKAEHSKSSKKIKEKGVCDLYLMDDWFDPTDDEIPPGVDPGSEKKREEDEAELFGKGLDKFMKKGKNQNDRVRGRHKREGAFREDRYGKRGVRGGRYDRQQDESFDDIDGNEESYWSKQSKPSNPPGSVDPWEQKKSQADDVKLSLKELRDPEFLLRVLLQTSIMIQNNQLTMANPLDALTPTDKELIIQTLSEIEATDDGVITDTLNDKSKFNAAENRVLLEALSNINMFKAAILPPSSVPVNDAEQNDKAEKSKESDPGSFDKDGTSVCVQMKGVKPWMYKSHIVRYLREHNVQFEYVKIDPVSSSATNALTTGYIRFKDYDSASYLVTGSKGVMLIGHDRDGINLYIPNVYKKSTNWTCSCSVKNPMDTMVCLKCQKLKEKLRDVHLTTDISNRLVMMNFKLTTTVDQIKQIFTKIAPFLNATVTPHVDSVSDHVLHFIAELPNPQACTMLKKCIRDHAEEFCDVRAGPRVALSFILSNVSGPRIYTFEDVPRLAEYSASLYAKSEEERVKYFQHYSTLYTQELVLGNSINVILPEDSGAPVAALPAQTPSVPNGTDGRQWPAPNLSAFTFDQTSGYYYDHFTGLYYESSSQYFYNMEIGKFLQYDPSQSSYVLVQSSEISSAPVKAEATVPSENEVSVASAPNISQDAPASKSITKERKIHAKKVMKDLEKWSKSVQRQDKKKTISTVPSHDMGVTEKSSDVGFDILRRKTDISKPNTSLAVPTISSLIMEPTVCEDEEEEYGFIDWMNFTCNLCHRVFGNSDVLSKHSKLSDLHRNNLKQWYISKNLDPDNEDKRKQQYRDRAAERRSKVGKKKTESSQELPESWTCSTEGCGAYKKSGFDVCYSCEKGLKSAPFAKASAGSHQPQAVPDMSVGSQLLKKMGWEQGTGLGKAGQGGRSPVRVERQSGYRGLGAQKESQREMGESYTDFMKRSSQKRFQDLSRLT